MKRSITPNEPANFTPTLGEYKDLGPFRMWCQKVLPLVYDDSLSYYEVLCKLVNYLNVMLENVNTLDGDVTALHDAYKQLEAYVNNYFDSLDVQEEINQKLDEMIQSGEFSNLIEPFIVGSAFPLFVNSTSNMTDKTRIYVLTTNGHVYSWDGSKFADSGYVYSTDPNTMTGFTQQVTVPSILASANDAIPNRIYCIAYNGMADLPEGNSTGGTLICFNYVAEDRGGFMQLYCQLNGELFYRIKWGGQGGTWSSWIHASDKNGCDYYLKGMTSITYNQLADLNEALANRIYTINNTASNILNVPDGKYNGTLVTFNYTNENRSGMVQVFYSIDSAIYTRIKWGATPGIFMPWTTVSNPQSPFIHPSMFLKWGAIGDSFISGVCGNLGQFIELSWVQNMARRNGVTCTNYSQGGLTSETWLTNNNGLKKLQDDTETVNFMFIALGINDSGTLSHVELGSESDLTSTTAPNTFYGNMRKIYDAVIAKNSKTVVCFITIPRSGDRYAGYNKAIKDIAEFYNALLLDSSNCQLFRSNWWNNNMIEAHPTAVQYSAMSMAYEKELSKVLYDNIDKLSLYVG